MIDVINVTKKYGSITALHDVTFHVEQGNIIGLLGPNGAGKTTLMKVLTGYIQPTEGTAVIDGLDILTHSMEVKKKIGYLPENAPLYPEMSVQGYLQMTADLRKIPHEKKRGFLSDAINAVGLSSRLTRPIGELSKGYRQRVGLAQAILHKPHILVLDEPTSGLDPTQIAEVRRLIRRLARTSTVLISTHILSEVEATCDRAVIIMQGAIRADARLEELSATSEAIVAIEKNAAHVIESLKSLAGVKDVKPAGDQDGYTKYRVFGETSANLCPQIYDLARANDWQLAELKKDTRTLESVFNEMTAGGDVL
ncbi:MAG: ATP-binding cassette domain-containing protein [Desulfobacteria bacterium]